MPQFANQEYSGKTRARRLARERCILRAEAEGYGPAECCRAANVVEKAMTVDPHDTDEADEKGEVRGPLAKQQRREMSLASIWSFDLKYQQGDGNGKDTVRKSLNPRCLGLHAKKTSATEGKNESRHPG